MKLQKSDYQFKKRKYTVTIPVMCDDEGGLDIFDADVEVFKYTPHYYVKFYPHSDNIRITKVKPETLLEEEPEIWQQFTVVRDQIVNGINVRCQVLAPSINKLRNLMITFREKIIIGAITFYLSNKDNRVENKITVTYLTNKTTEHKFEKNYLIVEYRYVTTSGVVSILTKMFVIEYREHDLVNLHKDVKAPYTLSDDEEEIEVKGADVVIPTDKEVDVNEKVQSES